MNSFARVSNDKVVSVGELSGMSGAILNSLDYTYDGSALNDVADLPRVTLHSGLPIMWDGEVPAELEFSEARQLQHAAKRTLDVVLAALALVVLFPLLMIVSACIVATSRGPVLFEQYREGLGGKLFKIYKFRSMSVEAGDPTGVAQTKKSDPRVTPVGNFIRRTSIDELPQLLNVLRGDMSLVGPRPHVPGMLAGGMSYKALVPYYDQRLAVRPGLTGWAQANRFRGLTVDAAAAIARVEHDIAYVQNFSILLDLKIIGRTIVNEFVTGSGH